MKKLHCFSPSRDEKVFYLILDILASKKYSREDVKNFSVYDFLNLRYDGGLPKSSMPLRYCNWKLTAFEYEMLEFYLRHIRPKWVKKSKGPIESVFRYSTLRQFYYSSEKVFVTPKGDTQLEFLGKFVSIPPRNL